MTKPPAPLTATALLLATALLAPAGAQGERTVPAGEKAAAEKPADAGAARQAPAGAPEGSTTEKPAEPKPAPEPKPATVPDRSQAPAPPPAPPPQPDSAAAPGQAQDRPAAQETREAPAEPKAQPAVAVRGIVRATRQAWISTDLAERIERLPFQEGEAFRKGDVLAAFDCSDIEAELKSAEAHQAAELLVYENNTRLARLNATGRFEVQLSKVKAEQAAAAVEAQRKKQERCTIEAPFDGRVAQVRAHAYEMADRSQPLMQILDQSALEIDVLLPSTWLRWLKVGTPFEIAIEETGTTLAAEVVRLAPAVDPVSQTLKVIGQFKDSAPEVLPGMSGPTKFPVPDE